MPLFQKFEQLGTGAQTGVEAVLENLEHVLNTKRGWGSPLPDFGIRSLTEYVSREHLSRAVIEEIKHCIEVYEPRLKLEEITVEEGERSPFRLSFSLRCSLVDGTQTLRVHVNTMFGAFEVDRP